MDEHEGHEPKADDVERSLDELQERSGRLEDEIEGTGEDWERKQHDPGVPGAVGEADEAAEGGSAADSPEDDGSPRSGD